MSPRWELSGRCMRAGFGCPRMFRSSGFDDVNPSAYRVPESDDRSGGPCKKGRQDHQPCFFSKNSLVKPRRTLCKSSQNWSFASLQALPDKACPKNTPQKNRPPSVHGSLCARAAAYLFRGEQSAWLYGRPTLLLDTMRTGLQEHPQRPGLHHSARKRTSILSIRARVALIEVHERRSFWER